MLYIVTTPIGNLKDITLRALETLKNVDMIACEDKRVSGKLLKHFDIKASLFAYHDHSDDHQREKLLSMLKEGKKIALISDAGSPLIADPGFKLVRDCQKNDISYTVIPGVSSVIAGLQLSAMPTDQFYFGGFLPAKQEACKKKFSEMIHAKMTLVYFETAGRIAKTLNILKGLDQNRRLSIVREITKLYEQVRSGTADELLEGLKRNPIKGEIVLVIEGEKDSVMGQAQLIEKLKLLIPEMGLNKASAYLAKETDMNKKEIYQLGLDIKDE